MFVPAEGNVFVAADFSAIELRILALQANDVPFIQAFAEMDAGTGPDVHTFNACELFGRPKEQIT
jgi:DNA polymerase-1